MTYVGASPAAGGQHPSSRAVDESANPAELLLRPRLGFLGVGWIGRTRMEAVVRSGVADVTVVADPAPEMRSAAAEAALGAETAESFDALLSMPLDGVVIATPSALHAEQSIAALEAGLAVFCQKPVGRTAEEVSRVIETARRANRLLGVDLSYRYAEAFAHLREIVRNGGIGEVYAADLVFHNAYGPDKPWFYDPALAGGGCVMDLGTHLVDMALWVLGFPAIEGVASRLFAGAAPLSGRERVEDFATARIDLAGGTSVQIGCSWNLHVGRDAVVSATFHGSDGGIAVHNVNGSFYDFVLERYRGTQRETLLGPPDDWGGRAAVAWAERLAAGARFDPAADELLTVAEVLDRIYAG